jgi:hypothetical protein
VSLVAAEVPGLRRLGQQLRSSARERLMTALNEQNQATVGDCLQVSQLFGYSVMRYYLRAMLYDLFYDTHGYWAICAMPCYAV